MQVARGGGDVVVSQPLLQAVEVQTRFEQVGGVAMAQGVDATSLGDAGLSTSGLVPALGGDAVQGLVGGLRTEEEPLLRVRQAPP